MKHHIQYENMDQQCSSVVKH